MAMRLLLREDRNIRRNSSTLYLGTSMSTTTTTIPRTTITTMECTSAIVIRCCRGNGVGTNRQATTLNRRIIQRSIIISSSMKYWSISLMIPRRMIMMLSLLQWWLRRRIRMTFCFIIGINIIIRQCELWFRQ